MLGIVNRILGAAFGLLKSAFILSVILMFLAAMTSSLNLIDEDTRESSVLYSLIKPIAPAVLPSILEEVDAFRKQEQTEDPVELQSA